MIITLAITLLLKPPLHCDEQYCMSISCMKNIVNPLFFKMFINTVYFKKNNQVVIAHTQIRFHFQDLHQDYKSTSEC